MKRGHALPATQKPIGTTFMGLLVLAVMCGVLLNPTIMISLATAQDSKPIAIINGDSNVSVRQTVYLDGSMSSDPKGLDLNYQWTLVSSPEGSSAVLVDDTNSQAKFEADTVGIFKVKLVVNNGLVDSIPAYYTVTVAR